MEKITRNIFSISTSVLLTLCILQCMNTISLVESMDRKSFLNMHSDLTEFFRLLDTSQYFNATLKFKKGTLFAPTNDAINDFNSRNPGKMDNTTLGYHFCNIELNTKNLDEIVASDLQGNPPIFVTKVTTRQGTNIFLNDAQIIKGNLELTLERKQTVHIIDRVLEPTGPTSPTSSTELMNPDAKTFLEHSASYSISKDYGVKEFAARVAKLGKSEEFRELGRNTFFIPVDDAFKPTATNIENVDSTVIHGHMVIGKAIFLRSAQIDHQFPTYKTSAGASNFPVFVSFSKTISENTDGETAETWSVSSENIIGSGVSNHPRGIVHANVVKGNIPVKNGVIHLISQPLVLIQSPIYKVFQLDEPSGPMSEFLALINNYLSQDSEIKNLLNGQEKITLLVPTSEAIKKSSKIEYIKSKPEILKDIIYLHILRGEIRAENITHGSQNKKIPHQAETYRKDGKLFFNVIRNEVGETIFVEGGGTNASIEQPDIGATNGVIHLINRVLGVEGQTLYDKLESDPMLQLTNQERYNENFKNTQKRFTFFAPSNVAWETAKHTYPSEHLKLFDGSFGYQVGKLMDRHLVVGVELTMERLKNKIPHQAETYRKDGKLFFNVIRNEVGETIFVEGGGTNASIEQPDIGATNGVIHLINRVLGVEGQTLYDKLESDPMLQLTNQERYNENFKNTQKRFTFFAPSNVAWETAKHTYPSEHLKLFDGSFGYQVGKLMDRHLVVGVELTMERLKNVSEGIGGISHYELPIHTLNGGFRVFNVYDPRYTNWTIQFGVTEQGKSRKVSGDYNYVIFWNNRKSYVIRPNIKCTNGIIHIIDTLLMTGDDISVNSAKNFHHRNTILSLLTITGFFICSRILLY